MTIFLIILAVAATSAAVFRHRSIALQIATWSVSLMAGLYLLNTVGWLPAYPAGLWFQGLLTVYTLAMTIISILEPEDL